MADVEALSADQRVSLAKMMSVGYQRGTAGCLGLLVIYYTRLCFGCMCSYSLPISRVWVISCSDDVPICGATLLEGSMPSLSQASQCQTLVKKVSEVYLKLLAVNCNDLLHR